MSVHGVGERDQQGHPGKAADTGKNADDQPENDADADDGEACRVKHDRQSVERVIDEQERDPSCARRG
jgi:hypothetical protein